MSSRASNLAGFTTSISPPDNLSVGIVTATTLDVSGNVTVGQTMVNSAGSAAAPVISKVDDTNTGIFFPAADTIALSTAGTERIRFFADSSFLHNATSFASVFDGGDNTFGWDFPNGGRLVSSRNSTAASAHIVFYNPNGTVGSISSSGSSTAYNISSDYRLKENVVTLDGAIGRLKQLPVHRFNFIADPDTVVDGFIAHEAAEVVPECVTGAKDEVDDDGNPVYQGIDQSKLVPLLTAALQEAIAKIESLEQRLNDAGIN